METKLYPNVERVRVIDFETYYGDDYTLSKLTTEEYVRDPRFETIGFAYQDFKPDGTPIMQEPQWVTGDEEHIKDYLTNVLSDWDTTAVVAHNAGFDGSIMAWRYGVNPAMWCDTLSMSRPFFGLTVGGSLKALAKELGVGVKGTEVEDAKNMHRTDFTPEQMYKYAEYCRNDVALTAKLFFHLLDKLPASEMDVMDLILRMRTEPRLVLDVPMLEQWLKDYKAEQAEILRDTIRKAVAHSPKIAKKVQEMAEKKEPARKLFSSNAVFRGMLEALGYNCPMKVSPTTGKSIPALGKKDPEFMAFEEAHADDPVLQTLIAARKETKSTLLETRVQRFIDMGKRGPLPIPLRYYGAHTGRASGEDKLNFQNMPRKSVLRDAIMAPEGYSLVVADSGQIEARGVAWVAGERNLLEVFASGGAVYEWMASRIYGKPVEEVDKTERQVGKIAVLGLGYGMGASKYKDTLKAWTGIELPDDEAKRVVNIYREANANIKRYWHICDEALPIVLSGRAVNLGPSFDCPLPFLPPDNGEPARIQLPNGMQLRYPGLRYDAEQDGYVYSVRQGRKTKDKKLWGGVITENIVQALARIVVFDQMRAIEHQLRKLEQATGKIFQTVLTVHDEVVLVVPDEYAGKVSDFALRVMKTPPKWAAGWPLDADGGVAKRYGEAK